MSGAIHIVDDEETVRDALQFLFASRGLAVQSWPSGEAFLERLPGLDCSCVILDVRLGQQLSGPDVFERMRELGCMAPVIFLTGHADVPVAVRTLKAGAFDFLEKPFDGNQIVDLSIKAMEKFAVHKEVQKRLASLSVREQEVMSLVLKGELNKQIANSLGIANRTVEVHRGRILAKMGVRNATELALLLTRDNVLRSRD